MSKRVEITVTKRSKENPKGGIAVEAHGYVGQGCVGAVTFYAEKLGTVVGEETKTEYFQSESGEQQNTA